MKPPYKSLWPATALTYAGAPWRLIIIIWFIICIPFTKIKGGKE